MGPYYGGGKGVIKEVSHVKVMEVVYNSSQHFFTSHDVTPYILAHSIDPFAIQWSLTEKN